MSDDNDSLVTASEVGHAFVSALSTISSARKLAALSLLAHNLTVSARAVYAERDDRDDTVERLYTLNEVQHRLSNQMLHIANDNNDYTDEYLVDMLYSFARSGNCEEELTWALKFTLPHVK